VTTPQDKGRYGDYDVLRETGHWDEVTRRVVLDRVENVPPYRFFGEREQEVLLVLCDLMTAQDREPRVPVLAYIDEKQHKGESNGYQYFDMPSDREVWRTVARGLDEAGFLGMDDHDRRELVGRFAKGELHGGAWATLNAGRAFGIVTRDVCEAFYSHPWAWNEIGFGGPAYPRGYAAFGSPELGEREHWEAGEER
jgi:Gluconate 2-dehydrogenase subunit 3